MVVPYSSVAIANNFIQQFADQAGGIEHMKLQKLVYCSYGWWLAARGMGGVRLTRDKPEIWKHGPVFSELYHVFKIFGRRQITEMKSLSPFDAPPNVDQHDQDVRSMISWVWGRYGHLSSFALSDLTHRPGTPWHRVAQEHNFSVPFNMEIPDEYIFEEFSTLMTRAQNHNVGHDQAVGTA